MKVGDRFSFKRNMPGGVSEEYEVTALYPNGEVEVFSTIGGRHRYRVDPKIIMKSSRWGGFIAALPPHPVGPTIIGGGGGSTGRYSGKEPQQAAQPKNLDKICPKCSGDVERRVFDTFAFNFCPRCKEDTAHLAKQC